VACGVLNRCAAREIQRPDGHEGTTNLQDQKRGSTMEARTKENVTFLGLQRVPRGEALILVNNESGSTVTYDPARHNIVNMDGYVRSVLASRYW
jgi:hypothetical protein